MTLRGKKPTLVEKRLKVFFYGASGVGKTTAAIQFPSPYLIDTERGAENDQYVTLLEEKGGAVFQTSDFDELIKEIKALLTADHEYKTLIIDPLTILYNNLLEKSAAELKAKSSDKNSDGTEFGRHYGEANKKMKHLMNLLLRLDMNVIITSHAKNEYTSDMKVIGQTFDCYKKLDYLFDLVFEIQKRAKERVGIVRKTRIRSFPDGDVFPFSYEEISRRYGKDILEKKASKEELASKEEIKELTGILDAFKVPQSVIEKTLEKATAASFDEMKSEDVRKWIEHLKSKIQVKAA